MATASQPTLNVPTPLAFGFLYTPALGSVAYRCAYGGRGSAKSWQFARALLVHGLTKPLRILCAREYQTSIRDSVHKLLSDQIAALQLDGFYRITETSIVGENGTEFFFKGLRRDIAGIKSTEGIDICWIEEAEAVSAHSWQVLRPTIRKDDSEIWVTFNPALPSDATYVMFAGEKPPPRAIVKRVSWLDNPWMSQKLHEERLALLEADPEAYAHVWGGEPWTRSDAQVLNGKWRVLDFTPESHWQGPYYGADWGFAMSPTVIVKVWIADRRLYIERDDGKPQLDNDQTATLFRSVVHDARREVRADSEDPSRINEMNKRGLNVVPVKKWQGSVEAGIAHLRTYRDIVIHPQCKRAQDEARLWRYKVDPRTDEVLEKLVDGFDHVWDAVRYAIAPIIRASVPSTEPPPSISQSVA